MMSLATRQLLVLLKVTVSEVLFRVPTVSASDGPSQSKAKKSQRPQMADVTLAFENPREV